MGSSELKVLVVDDDFRVANMHAGIVNAMPGFTATTTARIAAAQKAEPVDLALVDVYLPDGSGIDFVRGLRCDSMVLSAATDAPTIRAAMAAGALSYIVKPFAPADLAARLGGYARYRRSCPAPISAARKWTPHSTPCARDRARPVPDRRGLADEGSCTTGATRVGSADVVGRDVRGDRRFAGNGAAVPFDACQLRGGQDPAPVWHDWAP